MGPVQMLVVGFPEDKFEGEIAAELERLADGEVIRLLSIVIARKDERGNLAIVEERATGGGSVDATAARRLVEAGNSDLSNLDNVDAGELWDLAETVPVGATVGIALIDHRWAVPLREAIARAGGQSIADEWVGEEELASIGLIKA